MRIQNATLTSPMSAGSYSNACCNRTAPDRSAFRPVMPDWQVAADSSAALIPPIAYPTESALDSLQHGSHATWSFEEALFRASEVFLALSRHQRSTDEAPRTSLDSFVSQSFAVSRVVFLRTSTRAQRGHAWTITCPRITPPWLHHLIHSKTLLLHPKPPLIQVRFGRRLTSQLVQEQTRPITTTKRSRACSR